MDSLVGLGATKAFGVPGESYLAVLDAMVDHANSFDLVLCRQEGGAAYMAAATSKDPCPFCAGFLKHCWAQARATDSTPK